MICLAKDQGFRFEALPIRFSDGMEVRRVTKIEQEEPYETLTVDVLLVNPNLEEVWASRHRPLLPGCSSRPWPMPCLPWCCAV